MANSVQTDPYARLLGIYSELRNEPPKERLSFKASINQGSLIVPDPSKEHDPCNFLNVFQRFVINGQGKPTPYVKCFSLGNKDAHLLVGFPGMNFRFFSTVSAVHVSKFSYPYFSSDQVRVSLEFSQRNGKRFAVNVTDKGESVSEIRKG